MTNTPKPVVLGTAGHVDHGKTALVRALTGVDTDRLEEEKRRGITIDLGFAPFPSPPDLLLSVVDVPGHEDFVRNMLAGATGIDLVLLVVAADEGPMPQTREHLAIVSLLGIRHGVTAVTKADLADPAWLDLAVHAARQEVRTVAGAEWPVIPVSAMTGAGLDDLRAAILTAARTAREKRTDDLFRMPVDRVFTLRGAGTVVTGTVWSGQIDRDAEIMILPSGRTARVRTIQVHGVETETAAAGRRAALALAGVNRDEIRRGDTLVAGEDDVWRATTTLDVELHLLPFAARPVRSQQRVRVHLGTSEVMARVVLLDGRELAPGASALARLRLEAPLVARGGDRFVVRFYSPVTTIGGGRVLNPWAARRLREDDLSLLRRLSSEEPTTRVHATVALARWQGITAREAAVLTGLSPRMVEEATVAIRSDLRIEEIADRWYSSPILAETEARLLDSIRQHHARDPARAGIPLEALRAAIPAPRASGLAQSVLTRLEATGQVVVRGGVAALSDFRPALDTRRAALRDKVVERLRSAGLAPPDVKELSREFGEDDVVPVLKFLAQEGALVPVTASLYFEPAALSEAQARVEAFLATRPLATPGDLKSVLGVTRKHLIPILEWMDRQGVTARTPEGRRLRARETPSR